MTPLDGSTVIVMEYVSHTWRLPKPGAPKVHKTRANNDEVCVPNSISAPSHITNLPPMAFARQISTLAPFLGE